MQLVCVECDSHCSSFTRLTMSGKYAFTKTLKEVRFLHCQTSEHSAAVRYVKSRHPPTTFRTLISFVYVESRIG